MLKFIIKYAVIGTIIYVIILAIADKSDAQYGNANILERSCSYAPSLCHSGQEVFYAIGTQIRNGLRYVYLLSDKYLTQSPIEETNITYYRN